ncbi:hypothetical protein [uncultured Cytophaga sp.]|uniref:hypothetical protein n=1 Tax=uncultured Cytophaga sp. TaxID=160238 RepID=UPI0026023F0A|nr:hypothetical protein [uncultured Cytophaga sp.]
MEALQSKKTKQELIQMAVDILTEKQPSLVIDWDAFEYTAWKNSKELLVTFRRYIRFIALNAQPQHYYDITVNLVTKQILPFESGYTCTFYVPTETDKKKLDFIKSISDLPSQSTSDITITENEDHYWISETNKIGFRKFFIDKKTGFKSGVMEGSYSIEIPKPVVEDVYQREEMLKLYDTDEISRITRNAIIRIAIGIITKEQPAIVLNFDDYEKIVLGDSKNALVEFRRIVRYTPLGIHPEKRFSYDINVNLNTNTILPFDDTFASEFYIETEADKKALEFIKKHTGNFSSDFKNIIHEEEEHYSIDTHNTYSLQISTLHKKTGEVEIVLNGHMDPMPRPTIKVDLDALIEIK